MMKSKIISLEALEERINTYRKQGKRIVLCYGVFGALHIGHIRYLKEAQKYGDVVVVVLTPDNHSDPVKKEYHESLRAEAIAHLDWIDAVAVNSCGNVQEMVKRLRPDVYAKGFESVHVDDKANYNSEEEFFESLGIQHVVVKEGEFTSTAQINRYFSGMSKDALDYIYLFKQRYAKGYLLSCLEQLQTMKILVIGDTILDEYQYCNAIGKSSKDPTLVLKYWGHDLFAGGILAVANHVANFAHSVDLVSVLGENDTYEEFIRSRLKHNVVPFFVFKPDAPTLIKRRFIDGYSTQKLFEVYVMDDSSLKQELDEELSGILRQRLPDYDLVVVADYGHGALTRNMINILTTHARFLAVNTQSNAGNRGFNTISKYPKADYVSLAEHEIRLETRDLVGRIFPMMSRLARDMSTRQFAVTRGRKGCMVLDNHGDFIQVPSFAENVVDRVGAGDAFFALTSMFSAIGASSEVVGFVGNVMGSVAVQIMGNRNSIGRDRIEAYMSDLLG